MISFNEGPRFIDSAARIELQDQQRIMKQQIKEVKWEMNKVGAAALVGAAATCYAPLLGGLFTATCALLGMAKGVALPRMHRCIESLGTNKETLFHLRHVQLGIHNQIALLQKADKKEVQPTIQAIKKAWYKAGPILSSLQKETELLATRQRIVHLSKTKPAQTKTKLHELLTTSARAVAKLIEKEETLGEKIQDNFAYYKQV